MSTLVSAATKVAEKTPPANWFVVCMGVGTVFVGLILIIVFCKIIGAFCQAAEKKKPVAPQSVTDNSLIENRGEIIAAVVAALAEELGTDVSGIRILSFKKI